LASRRWYPGLQCPGPGIARWAEHYPRGDSGIRKYRRDSHEPLTHCHSPFVITVCYRSRRVTATVPVTLRDSLCVTIRAGQPCPDRMF